LPPDAARRSGKHVGREWPEPWFEFLLSLHQKLERDAWLPVKRTRRPSVPSKSSRNRPPSRLFRRRYLDALSAAHGRGELQCFGEFATLTDASAFAQWLAPLRKIEWVVYAKRPFAGPAAVLAYLSRYTHRVAISNSRLLSLDERGVSFRWKDYRAQGRTRHKTMTLSAAEFMRRFLLHVLPAGFHRLRHYGLLANPKRKRNLELARVLLSTPPVPADPATTSAHCAHRPTFRCRHCGAPMLIIQILERAQHIRAPPASSASP
jgi:hypothetical protein